MFIQKRLVYVNVYPSTTQNINKASKTEEKQQAIQHPNARPIKQKKKQGQFQFPTNQETTKNK